MFYFIISKQQRTVRIMTNKSKLWFLTQRLLSQKTINWHSTEWTITWWADVHGPRFAELSYGSSPFPLEEWWCFWSLICSSRVSVFTRPAGVYAFHQFLDGRLSSVIIFHVNMEHFGKYASLSNSKNDKNKSLFKTTRAPKTNYWNRCS